jgi:hypothetical protein
MSAIDDDGISLLAPDFLLNPFDLDMPYSSSICREIRSAPASLTSSRTLTMWR